MAEADVRMVSASSRLARTSARWTCWRRAKLRRTLLDGDILRPPRGECKAYFRRGESLGAAHSRHILCFPTISCTNYSGRRV
jgi:hypothetical protein